VEEGDAVPSHSSPLSASPWLDALADGESAAVLEEATPGTTGLRRPLRNVTADGGLLQDFSCPEGKVAVVGAHGGAGESLLERVDPALFAAADHCWPLAGNASEVPALVVARGDYLGLEAARTTGKQWAAGELSGIDLLGLVVMADQPKQAKQLKDLAAVIGGLFPRLWIISYSVDVRLEGSFGPSLPKDLRKLLSDVQILIKNTTEPHQHKGNFS
jgi:hypothetical protein